ncbi:TetR/AcrR family transcriptional regulator [Agrobacterium rhizogenes]|nr:TetR/AcrR family transcriptional regulator [Rhizobium rhizogenes]NTJ79425.1 TetR/AcrR family transcriptional regulator [Rhizobium rhizogenes]
MTKQRSAGRPRNEEASDLALAAARRLVHEHGYDSVTMSMIADAAGIGRQSVYRRWSTKADLVMDALISHVVKISVAAEGDVVSILSSYLSRLFEGLEVDGSAIKSLIAAAQKDPEFERHFNARFVLPRNEALIAILRKGVDAGELSPDANPKVGAELIHGAFWFRLLLGRPLDAKFALEIAQTVVGGMKVTGTTARNATR